MAPGSRNVRTAGPEPAGGEKGQPGTGKRRMSKSRWNHFQLNKLQRTLREVNSYADAMRAMPNADLQGMTDQLRGQLRQGRTLDQLLPQAFAAMREAARRVLGKYPYDVQVLGGIALHQGRIAEMKTGEGKTLVATMPLYLNALSGQSCILVTTNSYLAARDGTEMAPLYEFMGLREAVGVPQEDSERFSNAQKKEIYAADIVYTTNDALAFDYLFENLENKAENRYLRGMDYVIVDEADAVLLDSAQIPLIVSGMPRVQSNLFGIADYFVTTLDPEKDYQCENKDVWLLPPGIEKARRFFRTQELFNESEEDIVRHICLALRAHLVIEKEDRYIVRDHAVQLLDERTGRVQPNTKLRSGQHQALEAKEQVPITKESRTVASVTYQSFFNMYRKVAGMTGTGVTDADEFRQIYGLDVVAIPTRRKIQRIDRPDVIYPNLVSQLSAALEEIRRLHERQQPVLVIASSIHMSDLVSQRLLQEGIPHNVLNAYNIAKEAAIIQEAGQKNAVTVATTVAGRGTDIRLGEGVEELGGLAIIGIGLISNKRQELQSRGRSGRQGDPGFSRFYLSLEDEVVDEFGRKWLKKCRKGNEQVHSPVIIRAVHDAQRISAELARSSRKATKEFGESMEKQRNLVYAARNHVMESMPLERSYYRDIFEQVIENFLNQQLQEKGELPGEDDVMRFCMDHISYSFREFPDDSVLSTRESIRDYLLTAASAALDQKLDKLGSIDQASSYMKIMTLRAIDQAWVEQVDYLQQLRQVVSGRQYARHNVKYAFHEEAYRAFETMQLQIKTGMMRNILLGELIARPDGGMRVLYP